jgi:hypothetical protein
LLGYCSSHSYTRFSGFSGDSDMTYWEILGVEPGADEKTVRRAYAARLKAIDQMTEPEAFQALRHAYEVMLAHARYLSSAPEPVVREEASSSG